VSLGQAGEIARTEAEVPGSEAELLPLAKQSGLSKVRDEARKKRANAIPAEDLHDRQRAARSMRHWRDDLGMIAGTFRLTPDVGVPFVNRLERDAQRLRRAAKQRGDTVERFEAYAADAFADMIQATAPPAKSKRRDVDAVIVCDLRASGAATPTTASRATSSAAARSRYGSHARWPRTPSSKAVIHDGVQHPHRQALRPAHPRRAAAPRSSSAAARPRRRHVLRQTAATAATASSGTTTTRRQRRRDELREPQAEMRAHTTGTRPNATARPATIEATAGAPAAAAKMSQPAAGQVHGTPPHTGQPSAYRARASSIDRPSWFASEASQASTSPSSWSCSSRVPLRVARANSPTSSVSQAMVAGTPRDESRSP
jgi:hypothetical protein